MSTQVTCTYLLPIRCGAFNRVEAARLRHYFEQLARVGCEVLVVDGSPAQVYGQNRQAWRDSCRHEPVDRRFRYLNDKVNGIHTGIALASSAKIILADDDIRYSSETARAVIELLEDYQVVRPQNFLWPLPWWAKTEAARMLINRATLRAADYPGTCGFRRSTILKAGHYDGDVLFDNEEIIRHFAVHGCSIAFANDLFVRKRPPKLRKWVEQRPRQAYEDFAIWAKTSLFFALLPLLIFGVMAFGVPGLLGCVVCVTLGSTLLAVRGRARGRAAEFFPIQCCFFAPLWVCERTLSTWWALYWYLRHGGYPFGHRVLSKGVGRAWWNGARAAAASTHKLQSTRL
jgi:hypothetical protein